METESFISGTKQQLLFDIINFISRNTNIYDVKSITFSSDEFCVEKNNFNHKSIVVYEIL